jgi:hypothetical protein
MDETITATVQKNKKNGCFSAIQRIKRRFIKKVGSLESQDLSTRRLDTIHFVDDKVDGCFNPAFNHSEFKSEPDDFSSLIKTKEILNSTFGSIEVTSAQGLSALKISDNRSDENIICKKVSCKN